MTTFDDAFHDGSAWEEPGSFWPAGKTKVQINFIFFLHDEKLLSELLQILAALNCKRHLFKNYLSLHYLETCITAVPVWVLLVLTKGRIMDSLKDRDMILKCTKRCCSWKGLG
jgi:hypothetical protein